jgi:hypothetical protein
LILHQDFTFIKLFVEHLDGKFKKQSLGPLQKCENFFKILLRLPVFNGIVFIFKFLYYGIDYPQGYQYFRKRLKTSFVKNIHVQDENEIEMLIDRGKFVIKEIDALYKLKKYRAMRKNYYDEENITEKIDEILKKT